MPQQTKTFRVFVSSTFTDMRLERRILQTEVFPKLKALSENRGASFQDVDLRWGVNEEAQLDQKTMDICLGEIARCQRLSPKPNFIVLLGDKYGWQPIPDRIPSSEMESILLALSGDEKMLIDAWYREDMNAVPPEYMLQPRGKEYAAYEDWQKVEDRLRKILRNALTGLPFTEAQKVKYFASATHQEIIRGALNPPVGVVDPEEHVFAYMRTIRGLPDDSEARDFADVSAGKRDVYSKDSLEQLKKGLKTKLPPNHVYEYGAEWQDGSISYDFQGFAAKVYEGLRSVIESQLVDTGEPDPIKEEVRKHEEFKQQRLEHFTGREEALQVIEDYLDGHANKVFAVIGAAGTGKTSLMAKAIEKAESRLGVKVFRFIGRTSATSDEFRLLYGLINEITAAYNLTMQGLLKGDEDETKFSTLRGLTEILTRCLRLANEERPLTIFLDALDQLVQDYASIFLEWLPRELPQYAKIVVSALPELVQKLSHTETYELGDMGVSDGKALLNKWLISAKRTLQPHQEKGLLSKFEANGKPLYLKLAFEQAKSWLSHSQNTSLSTDIDGILDEYFESLEKAHGHLLVQKVCGYILSSKYQGLAENEILGLLAFDQEYWESFVKQCHRDHRQEVQEIGKLPIVVWSRLFLDLEPYLSEREADGVSVISFYHRKFMGQIAERYATTHLILADYFEQMPLYRDENEEMPNARKVVEQSYQEILARKWKDVADKSLSSFPFLMAKTNANMVEIILADYRLAFDNAPQEIKDLLKLWKAFFQERAHILRRGNPEWPSYKILLQLAMEHADDSPVTLAAELYLKDNRADWVWIRRIRRVKNARVDPCWAVLEGHNQAVTGALQLSDSRILSWSDDRTLRLWDHEGTPITVFEGHTGHVHGALELSDGHILSWPRLSSEDDTLRLWDRQGSLVALFEGHNSEIERAIELFDGRILSWSTLSAEDHTLHLWNHEGKLLSVLEGHAGFVHGALELSDGRIISWSDYGMLRLWDHDGKLLSDLEGHVGSVYGAIELSSRHILSWCTGAFRLWDHECKLLTVLEGFYDMGTSALELSNGRILTWSSLSSDYTLHLWCQEGRPSDVLYGHTNLVLGALELSDGRILSWSRDGSLRCWDKRGALVTVFEGHRGFVNGALELTTGYILSWSSDRTLILWNKEGDLVTVFEGHSGPVLGAVELTNGHILSWCEDGTLRLWYTEFRSILVLEKHMDKVWGTIELSDERILSWSDDGTLRLWDKEGKQIAVFEGHAGRVNGALQLSTECILSWSFDRTDRALRLWDKEGKPLAILEGHTRGVINVLETKDSHILSWARDNTLRLWDKEGEPLAVLEGHTDGVRGVLEMKDGRFLSWSRDRVLRLWDKEGKPLAVLKGHGSLVFGALELSNGHILSWSYDHTLYLWDQEGRPIDRLYGHTDYVYGALQLSDGRILSWSADHTLRLWDWEGLPTAVLDGHIGTELKPLELPDGRILSWSDYGTLRLWDKMGQGFYSCTIDDALARFSDFRIAYGSKESNVSHSLFRAITNTGSLTVFNGTTNPRIFWHGESKSKARHLKSDGRAVLTQENGEVSFLRVYHGNRPISIKELEEMYGIEQEDSIQ